jgi:hypothetical protein
VQTIAQYWVDVLDARKGPSRQWQSLQLQHENEADAIHVSLYFFDFILEETM